MSEIVTWGAAVTPTHASLGRIPTLRTERRLARWAPALALVLTALAVAAAQQPQTFAVLYNFRGYPTDGAGPIAGLLMDASGNLYGTTTYGGSVNLQYCGGGGFIGCGTVFELDTNGTETVLHNFNGSDGANPLSDLFMDAKRNLYGTTLFGGDINCSAIQDATGCGTVFKVRGKKESVLHRFHGSAEGADPEGGLVGDASGALYGTTNRGGPNNQCHCGIVFKLSGKKLTDLYAFTGGADGAEPTAGLTRDANGDLYGTAAYGGDFNCLSTGCGVVFKLVGKLETVLHTFHGPDGAIPRAKLFMDASGNLYSTTVLGGAYGPGTVFEVTPPKKETVLHGFNQDGRGIRPVSSVVRDAEGNTFGTTEEGGSQGAGIVFEITKDRKEKVLHTFCSLAKCADGAYPTGDLIMDSKGNLYGTAYAGGLYTNGVVFKITLSPTDK